MEDFVHLLPTFSSLLRIYVRYAEPTSLLVPDKPKEIAGWATTIRLDGRKERADREGIAKDGIALRVGADVGSNTALAFERQRERFISARLPAPRRCSTRSTAIR